jgi:enoyl-CoA hydratase/carnithine racemase
MNAEVKVTDRRRVRWIELERPESKNGLTSEVNAAIIEALEGAASEPEVRAVVITGSRGNFCSGLDLKTAGALLESPESLRGDLGRYFHGLIRALRDLALPTIASIDGPAVGFGLDLALACDIRVASERATFGEVFVRRGLMPDGGSSFHLPRLVGLGRALELMYTGDVIGADEALRIGLINHLVPVEELGATAAGLAVKIAAGPPLALAQIKRAVYAGLAGDLDAALVREERGQLELLGSADVREGIAAFLEKRAPEFKGE